MNPLWSILLSGSVMFAILYWGLRHSLLSSLVVAIIVADTVWLFAAFYNIYTNTH